MTMPLIKVDLTEHKFNPQRQIVENRNDTLEAG
jgi:hypothetical protein